MSSRWSEDYALSVFQWRGLSEVLYLYYEKGSI